MKLQEMSEDGKRVTGEQWVFNNLKELELQEILEIAFNRAKKSFDKFSLKMKNYTTLRNFTRDSILLGYKETEKYGNICKDFFSLLEAQAYFILVVQFEIERRTALYMNNNTRRNMIFDICHMNRAHCRALLQDKRVSVKRILMSEGYAEFNE